jgi:hypothetical protein
VRRRKGGSLPVMLIRSSFTAAATTAVLALVTPMASASAITAPAAQPPPTQSTLLTFVPPSVGPICVTIGPIIIGGRIISPGVHVCTSGVLLPPLTLPIQS